MDGLDGMEGKGAERNNFFFFLYFSQFHPEEIKCRDRLLKLNVTCVIAFDTERQVCHTQAVASRSPHIKTVFHDHTCSSEDSRN